MVALNYGIFSSISGSVSTGAILHVDPINGNDAAAAIAATGVLSGVSQTPFLTIQAANFAAAALAPLSAPTFPGTVFTNPQTTGGHLVGGTTYYFEITAVNAAGETIVSAEQTYTPPAGTSTNTITLNWTAVSGATGYKFYSSTSSGNENYSSLITGGSTSQFVITSSATGAVTNAPSVNTTSNVTIQLSAGLFFLDSYSPTLNYIRLTPNVSLNGAGIYSTVILQNGTASHAAISPGTNCTVSNLTIQTTGAGIGGLGVCLGCLGNSGSGTIDYGGDNVVISNVFLNGGSDCLFWRNSIATFTPMHWRLYNVIARSQFDTTNVVPGDNSSPWPLTVDFHDCDFASTSVDGQGTVVRCLAMSGLNGVTFNIYGGSYVCSGGSGGTVVVDIGATPNNVGGNAVNIYGSQITTSSTGGTQNSFNIGVSCVCKIGPGTSYDPSLVANSGTFTGTISQILGVTGTSVAPGPALGSGGGATTAMVSSSDDLWGNVSAVTGAAPSTTGGLIATLTYGAAKAGTLAPVVSCSAGPAYAKALGATAAQIFLASGSLTATNTYSLAYSCP